VSEEGEGGKGSACAKEEWMDILVAEEFTSSSYRTIAHR
jgi:hypothetical protein